MMKAVAYTNNLPIDNPAALVDVELPMPTLRPRDLLVEVQAIAVNPVDTKIRASSAAEAGSYKVLGWDAVGIVKAVGNEVSLFKVGDRVWYAGDILRAGCNSQFHAVDERIVGHAPTTINNAEAAALPLTTLTAWELLFDRLRITPSLISQDAMLVIGAAGGVGSILIQLAHQLTGLTVIATASRPETEQWVRERGADYVINHHQPLSEELARIGIPQVKYVVSLHQTQENFDEIIKCLLPQGHLGLIDDPSELNATKLKSKALSLHWELMFTRSLFQTPDMINQHHILNKAADLIDKKVLQTTIGDHFGIINAANLRRAHALIETQQARGKIVLEGW